MPNDTRSWRGNFTGADSLEGTYSGSWSAGSAGVEWDGAFEASR